MMESLEQLREDADMCTQTEGDFETVWITKKPLIKDIDAIEREVEERYVELPKDANGEYIHIGDRVEDNKRVARIVLADESWEPTVYVEERPGVLREYFCNEIGHYHDPTVEDVLREFASERIKLFLMMPMSMSDEGIREFQEENREACEKLTAEYAAKLQLKEDR